MAGKKKFTIIHKVEDCIGCGACAAVSSNWVIDGEKAKPKETELDSLKDNKEAAESCPVSCIHIIDNSTKKKLV
jgi:ferredoxin